MSKLTVSEISTIDSNTALTLSTGANNSKIIFSANGGISLSGDGVSNNITIGVDGAVTFPAINTFSVNNLSGNSLSIGNSTVNIYANSSLFLNGNVNINGSGLSIGNSTVNVSINSVSFTLGSNLIFSPSLISIGNSTVNASVNSSGFYKNGGSVGDFVYLSNGSLSGNSVTISSGFSTIYRKYVLYIDNFLSGGAMYPGLQFSVDGGNNWITTGYSPTGSYITLNRDSDGGGGGGGMQLESGQLLSLTINFHNLSQNLAKAVDSSSATAIEATTGVRRACFVSGNQSNINIINAIKISSFNANTFTGNYTLYGIK